jgi:hypothetical protein
MGKIIDGLLTRLYMARFGDGANDYDVPRIDASTHAMQTIEYEHHEIHSGSHYFIDDVVDLAINNVLDIQWTTPNTTQWAHLTFNLATEAETEWYAYEGVTINTPGTAVTPPNSDRNSGNTSNATIATITNTSVANANADTAVAGATQIAHGIVGAGRNGGFERRDREIILKQNSIYSFRAIANAAGYINFVINWYEHTNKD